MNISPKSRFKQNDADVKKLATLVKEDWFHRALEFAALQQLRELTEGNSGDLTSSAVGFHRLAGAKDFVNILLNLHEMPVVSDRQPIGNLNHQV